MQHKVIRTAGLGIMHWQAQVMHSALQPYALAKQGICLIIRAKLRLLLQEARELGQ
jgi:hypothetical protein